MDGAGAGDKKPCPGENNNIYKRKLPIIFLYLVPYIRFKSGDAELYFHYDFKVWLNTNLSQAIAPLYKEHFNTSWCLKERVCKQCATKL